MDNLLDCFRRYLRGCQRYPDSKWSSDIISEYESDKTFYQELYDNRHNSFDEVNKFSKEQLFLRCCEKLKYN